MTDWLTDCRHLVRQTGQRRLRTRMTFSQSLMVAGDGALKLAGLPWGWHFNPHTHPIPTGIPIGIPMVIPIPTAALEIGPRQCEIVRPWSPNRWKELDSLTTVTVCSNFSNIRSYYRMLGTMPDIRRQEVNNGSTMSSCHFLCSEKVWWKWSAWWRTERNIAVSFTKSPTLVYRARRTSTTRSTTQTNYQPYFTT